MHNNYLRKSFYGNHISSENPDCLGNTQGVFWKEETKSYLNIDLRKGVIWPLVFSFQNTPWKILKGILSPTKYDFQATFI